MKSRYQDVEDLFNTMISEIGPKKVMIDTLVGQAYDFLEKEGYDKEAFSLTGDVSNLVYTSMQEFIDRASTDGIVVNVLTSATVQQSDMAMKLDRLSASGDDETACRAIQEMDRLSWYTVQAHLLITGQDGQMRTSWVMCEMRGGRLYARINGRWTPHYTFEDGGTPNDCDLCSKRMDCPYFLDMLSDDYDSGQERTDLQLTSLQKSDAKKRGIGDLLEVVGIEEGNVSDARWKEIRSNTSRLIPLYLASNELLDFLRLSDGQYVLASSDYPDHMGFAIRQRNGQYELCQIADSDSAGEAAGHQYVPSPNREEVVPIAETKDMGEILHFVRRYADRSCNGEQLFTIPLSLKRALQVRGEILRNPKARSRFEGNGQGWTKEEKMNADGYLRRMRRLSEGGW